MQAAFEKIIEKLEEEKVKGIYDSSSIIGEKNVWDKAIEIVKHESEKYKYSECGFVSKSDVLKVIEDIKCNDNTPKNYGTLLDIMRKIRILPTVRYIDWVPCSDRLPEESLNSVIGWDEFRERCVFVQYLQGQWKLGDWESVKITHWMNVPEKPKGE